MRRRSLVLLVATVALVAVVVVGLLQSSGSSDPDSTSAPSRAEVRRLLAGSPPPLAHLHERGSRLLPAASAKRELAALQGFPVVVNKWAAWCGPCRSEFPVFQRVSADLGKRVAFLGLDAGDGPAAAERFLGSFPVSYPSISDPDLKTVKGFGIAGAGWPTTIFYDAQGTQTYVHQGAYAEADLRADIKRYARG